MSLARPRVLMALAGALALGVAGLLALTACGSSPAPAETSAPAKVTLQLNWFHEAEFVGYYVAEAKGFYKANGLDVDIREGGPGDPARGPRAGRSRRRSPSPPSGSRGTWWPRASRSTAVMAAFQIPPLVIFSLAESGHREARATWWASGWASRPTTGRTCSTRPSRRRASTRPRSDRQGRRGRPAGPLRPPRRRLARLCAGRAHQGGDGRPPGEHHLPGRLRRGRLRGPGARHDSTIEADPQLVRRFVQASQQGWRYAVEHPDEAAQILLKWAPEPGLEFQKLAVRAVAPLVDTPQAAIGWIDAVRWQPAHGGRLRPRPPGLHHDLRRAGALTGLRRRPAMRPTLASGRPRHALQAPRVVHDQEQTAPLLRVHRGVHRGRHQRRHRRPRVPRRRTTGWSASSSRSPTLKQQEVESWIGGLRLNLDIVLSADGDLRGPAHAHPGRSDLSRYQAAYAGSCSRFTWAASRMGLFEELFFMGPRGEVLVSTDRGHERQQLGMNDYFIEGLQGKYIQEPSYSLSLNKMTVVASCPVAYHDDLSACWPDGPNLESLNAVMIGRAGLGRDRRDLPGRLQPSAAHRPAPSRLLHPRYVHPHRRRHAGGRQDQVRVGHVPELCGRHGDRRLRVDPGTEGGAAGRAGRGRGAAGARGWPCGRPAASPWSPRSSPSSSGSSSSAASSVRCRSWATPRAASPTESWTSTRRSGATTRSARSPTRSTA